GVRAGWWVGPRCGRAGVFRRAWPSTPCERAFPGACARALVRHRPDDPEPIREAQLEKLIALQAWCRHAGKPLVVEVLVGRRHEAEDEFESSGRPRMLAAFIGEAYSRNLVPEFWKIEGTVSAEGAPIVDDAI